MFEGIVASLLNRYLGKYVEEFDLENLNVGIFSGNVQLQNLKLKPEALYELGLPISVKLGTIGKLNLSIPWNRLCNQTSVIIVEEIFIVASPVTYGKYNHEEEKKLLRAEKKRLLNKLDSNSFLSDESPNNFTETLITSILNNLKIYIHKIHIRYEDLFTNSNFPVSFGVCVHNFSIENTNSKWKPISHSSKMGSLYQIVKIESVSVYCNANCNEMLLQNEKLLLESNSDWVHYMRHSLETFRLIGETFDFIIKPMSARLKIIINKCSEPRIPKLLMDFVLQDAALQLSHQQYLALVQLYKSFHRISINRLYRKFRPDVPIFKNVKKWWKYAYNSVVDEAVKPYTWSNFFSHRKNYRVYCDTYKKMLLDSTNTEIKIDLQHIEDKLDIYNIIIAREQTKLQFRDDFSDKILLKELVKSSFWMESNLNSKMYKLYINNKKNGVWNQLSQNEKNSLCEMIGFVENNELYSNKPKQYIEYKFNFTIANFNFSLISGKSEIAVFTMSHILTSIEMRPTAKAYKLSTRIESIIIEGASVEYNLIPIITSENILNGNQRNNFLMFDFEKNPTNNEIDYLLSISSNSLEIIYHEFSVSLFASFLQTPTLNIESAVAIILNKFKNVVSQLASDSVHRHRIFHINVDINLPHFIVPEFGSFLNQGSIIILDFGRLKIWSELQPSSSNLEDATKLELEEKLYDRFHFDLTDFQILMFNYDQNWNNFKKMTNSHYYILSKVHSQIIFSNSIKSENKQLPRCKLNVSFQKLKITISDGRIISMLNFMKNLPRPKSYTVLDNSNDLLLFDHIKNRQVNLKMLEIIQHMIASKIVTDNVVKSCITKKETNKSSLNVDSAVSSEISDEESEVWAKMLDLPGFDDSISQNNPIIYLCRINIIQIVLVLKRSTNNFDKPYIILNASNFCYDVAVMEYGSAVQISLGSVNIIDKLHFSVTSVPIQLLNSEKKFDFISILYRKVRSDCPDFKSHFHCVEQSFITEVNEFQIIFHREALIDLYRYLQYFSNKVKTEFLSRIYSSTREYSKRLHNIWFKSNDPPVPPGTTKFSYSARLSSVKFQLCDSEIDFLLIKISEFELDFLFKANERFILRTYLGILNIDDVSNTTLYPKVLMVEEEKLIEIKYSRHIPRLEKTNIESNFNDIKSDGNLKLKIGRIHFVLVSRLICDIQKFFSPFVPVESSGVFFNFITRKLYQFFTDLRFRTDKIHISIDCQLPVFLLPQQACSPNLIIFNIGDLTIENLFKELHIEETSSEIPLIVDNILIKLDSIFISRAIVNMNGSIIVQETIMEPVCCKIDIKRLLIHNKNLNDYNNLSVFEVSLSLDKIIVNLGQKDLIILNLAWFDNIEKTFSFFCIKKQRNPSLKEEDDVRKLQAFFYRVGNKKELSFHASLDGLDLRLYTDIDEVLSSPIRDENRSLCTFKINEIMIHGLYYTNSRSENQISIQSISLEDTRSLNNICIRRIFQSYGSSTTQSNNENVCITVPPVISITLSKNQSNESRCDVLIDHTRLNLSLSFLMELSRFFLDTIPCKQKAINSVEGLINYGYIGENLDIRVNEELEENLSLNMNSYCDDNLSENSGGISLSVICRKPEIMFFSQLEDFSKSHALLLRCDFSFEYIRYLTNKNFTCVISDLHMLSKLQSKLIKTSSDIILQPCNIEISQNWVLINNETKISINCDKIITHISASSVHTILNIIRELNTFFFADSRVSVDNSTKNFYQDYENLWTPKKITPYYFLQKSESPIRKLKSINLIQSVIISIPIISIMFEIEDIIQKKPVLLIKMHAEAKLKNVFNSIEMKGDINVQCSYYNYNVNVWEPIIEPSIKTENIYRPWEISIKAFKSKSYPIYTVLNNNRNEKNSESRKKNSISTTKVSNVNNSNLHQVPSNKNDVSRKKNVVEETSHSDHDYEYSDTGSDSENEDIVMEKLKSKFGQLLTGSDESTDTDSEITDYEDQSNNSGNISQMNTYSYITNDLILFEKQAEFIAKQRESSDSGLESENNDKTAMYVIFEAQESFELVITPSTILVFKQLLDSFSLKFNNISLSETQFLSLKNDITPHSMVVLYSKSAIGSMKILMCASYSLDESSPSSRDSLTSTPCNMESPSDLEFNSGIENFEGEFAPDSYSKSNNAKRKSDGDILLNALQFPQMSVDILYNKIVDLQLHINIPGFNDLIIICPTRTSYKYHAIYSSKENIRYYIIVSVQNDLCSQSIIVRSPLQIKNETCYAMALYYKKNAIDTSGFEYFGEITNPFKDSFKFGIVEPHHTYNVPLIIAYHCAIYVLPMNEECQLSEIGLWWRELANTSIPKDIICKSKDENSPVFVIRAVTCEGVKFSNMNSVSLPNFMIRLLPSVVFYNLLPCAFHIKIPATGFSVRIEAGGKSSLYSVDMNMRNTVFVEVPIYSGITWNGDFNLSNKLEEKLLLMTTEQEVDEGNKQLLLNIQVEKSESYSVVIYSSYWIINKTTLPLQIKSTHPETVYVTLMEEPLFFTFRKSQKRLIRLRVYQSSWSSVFCIDRAGCCSLITCRDNERNRSYYIIVEISLSQISPQNTKIITLLPYFLLSNEYYVPIRIMEENEQADLWIDLPQNQITPFWPETNSMKMYVKLKDSSLVSQHFFINQECQTVLRMDRGGALVVDITGGQNKSFLLVFRNYKEGDAPVRIDNFCEDLFLKISQENLGQVTLLSPYQSLLYTWDDPTIERKIQWNIYNRKNKGFTSHFKTDSYGKEFVNFKLIKRQSENCNITRKGSKFSLSSKKLPNYNDESNSSTGDSEKESDVNKIKTHKGKVIVFWISYMEGNQRILLFTQNEELAYYAYSKIDSERSNNEIFISIKGVGLSLVRDYKCSTRELAYISLSDSSAIWEINIAHSWKILPLELATWIEHQWIQGIKKAQMKDYVDVDLEKMHITKPFYGELRRSYYPAVWIHFRKSANYFYLQWKIHKFQIDNQLPDTNCPTVIYPKVISYDVIRKYGLKPCIEGTVLKKHDDNYSRNVYKYIKFTVSEFYIQFDKIFLLSVYDLMQPWLRVDSPSLRIRADICKIHHPLTMTFNNRCKNQRKTIVEYLFISPIKIQLSFICQNVKNFNSNIYDHVYTNAFLHYLLNCINANYVNSKGIKLKSPHFEEHGITTNLDTKFSQVYNFYLQNLLQPIYTHFLGKGTLSHSNLEIDLCDEYVEFFYDLSLSFEKKIDEFADAISEDARRLLSHVISPLSNSSTCLILCGKRTSLDLGLNPEILKKKNISQQVSLEEPEKVLSANNCFEIGVLYGLSGVHLNSFYSSERNDIELFFKSAGKHLLRLLNKYSNTIVNMPLATIDGIRRAAETGTDIIFRRRLPKYINPFGMRPYSEYHAIGLNILCFINKGMYSKTDIYWTHVVLTHEGKSCLLLTLQRIFLLSKFNLWDEWKTEWCIRINDITEVPQIIDNKLTFKIRQEKSVHNFDNDDKILEHNDKNLLFWIQKMIEIIFIINLENKPCFFVQSQISDK